MGQKGSKHYKSRHYCHCLGSEITSSSYQGGRVPILSKHPVCMYVCMYVYIYIYIFFVCILYIYIYILYYIYIYCIILYVYCIIY